MTTYSDQMIINYFNSDLYINDTSDFCNLLFKQFGSEILLDLEFYYSYMLEIIHLGAVSQAVLSDANLLVPPMPVAADRYFLLKLVIKAYDSLGEASVNFNFLNEYLNSDNCFKKTEVLIDIVCNFIDHYDIEFNIFGYFGHYYRLYTLGNLAEKILMPKQSSFNYQLFVSNLKKEFFQD